MVQMHTFKKESDSKIKLEVLVDMLQSISIVTSSYDTLIYLFDHFTSFVGFITLLQEVEQLGQRLGYTCDNGRLHNVSLGQGQEKVAEEALKVAAKEGHWVILQVSVISVAQDLLLVCLD